MDNTNVYIHQIQAPADKNLLPLAAGLLSSYAKAVPEISQYYGIDIKVIREDPAATVASYVSPSALGFSVYSWNFQQSLEIARLAKLEDPELLVVFGGPMVGLSQRPGELEAFFRQHPVVDLAVHGMGEWTFAEVLLARLHGESWDSIAGITYRSQESETGFVSTSPAIFRRDLNELPSPFLDGTFNDVLGSYGERITGALWETNRGCPFHCAFCVQGDQIFDKVLMFDSDRLYRELDWISQQRIEYIFATDANFGIKVRDYDIAAKIGELKTNAGFPKFFMVNWTKNSSTKVLRTAAKLRESGIESRMTLGRQSFSPDTLTAINRQNIKLSTYDDLKQEAAVNNVASYTELILGLPGDSYQSFVDSIELAMDSHSSHYFIVYLCRLLDGTDMASQAAREKYRYETRVSRVGFGRTGLGDLGVDELEEIIVGTASMPTADWRRAHTFANVALSLYNTRLAFFVLNYLRQEHGIKLADFFEHLIAEVESQARSTVLKKGLSVVLECQQKVLDTVSTVVGTGFTGDMKYEPHEAASLVFLNELNDFYTELRESATGYLKTTGITADEEVLGEVFRYQAALIPTWNKPLGESVSFEHNIPQYFESLSRDGSPVAVRRQSSTISVTDPMDRIEDPVEFSKRKFTVAMFKIAQVQAIAPATPAAV